MFTMTFASDCSPWWYTVTRATSPESCATLCRLPTLSPIRVWRTLRCDGLSPSITDGIDLRLSAAKKCTSSFLQKSPTVTREEA